MDQNKNILVLMPIEEEYKKQLEEQAPSANFFYSRPNEVLKDDVEKAHIIIGNLPQDLLMDAKNLEWLQVSNAGVDNYVKDGALPKGVVLTNASGAYGLAISEYMIGVLLQIYKKLHHYRDQQQQHIWEKSVDIKLIHQSTVLIVGLGDIGSTFAKKMKALGACTIGVKRKNIEKPNYMDEVHLIKDLDSLLPRADVVAICLPGTKETHHLFSKERIAKMKKESVLINVGRGSIVDADAVYVALKSGHFMGAGLDVFETEPLSADHPLWDEKNAVITPHVSGLYHYHETLERIVTICAENLKRYFNDEKLRNMIDISAGY